jgi:hypothetical protein
MTPQDRQWAEMMQAAARMGVGPEGFWRLSLKEWRMLTAGAGSGRAAGARRTGADAGEVAG